MSSRELKTSKISLMLRTLENSDAFYSFDEIYLVFTSKKVNILFVFNSNNSDFLYSLILYVPVNKYVHVWTVSSHNHTFLGQA